MAYTYGLDLHKASNIKISARDFFKIIIFCLTVLYFLFSSFLKISQRAIQPN